MSIESRLADAELLWQNGRREGALLNALIAVAAAARKVHPHNKDRDAFVAFLKSQHVWTMAVEFRGQPVDLDDLFYRWLRCELVHTGSLPMDLRVDGQLEGWTVRAGGAPEYVLLVGPDWFHFLVSAARSAVPTGTA